MGGGSGGEAYCFCFVCSIFLFVNLGPVVKSIISLMSTLVFKILTVLVSTISNSQVFLLKTKASYFIFSAKILAYMPYLMIKVLTIR